MNDTMTTATTALAPSGPKAPNKISSIGLPTVPSTTRAISGTARISAKHTNAEAAMPT